MIVIDCRSGQAVAVGQWVRYPPARTDAGDVVAGSEGEDDWRLLAVEAGVFSANVLIERSNPSGEWSPLGAPGPVTKWIKCPIRWFHPAGQGHARVVLVPT